MTPNNLGQLVQTSWKKLMGNPSEHQTSFQTKMLATWADLSEICLSWHSERPLLCRDGAICCAAGDVDIVVVFTTWSCIFCCKFVFTQKSCRYQTLPGFPGVSEAQAVSWYLNWCIKKCLNGVWCAYLHGKTTKTTHFLWAQMGRFPLEWTNRFSPTNRLLKTWDFSCEKKTQLMTKEIDTTRLRHKDTRKVDLRQISKFHERWYIYIISAWFNSGIWVYHSIHSKKDYFIIHPTHKQIIYVCMLFI